jgi:hypothetical protein
VEKPVPRGFTDPEKFNEPNSINIYTLNSINHKWTNKKVRNLFHSLHYLLSNKIEKIGQQNCEKVFNNSLVLVGER